MVIGHWEKNLQWKYCGHLGLESWECLRVNVFQSPCGQLTGAEFACELLSQLTSLGKLLPETLAQVVVNVIAP